MPKAENYPIRPVLEYLGAESVPDVSGGRWAKMRCFKHEDRTPSASVSEHGYTCFSCGTQGDALKLIMEAEGVGFLDAKQRVEEIAGAPSEDLPPQSSNLWSGARLSL